MTRLIVLNGAAAGIVFAVGDVPAVVGRSPEAHLQIGDPWISNMHAMFEQRGDAVWVVDLDSRNGTFVGDERVTEARVPEGAVVRLGRTEIRASASAAAEAPPHAVPQRGPQPVWRPEHEGERGGPTVSTRSPFVREPGDDPYALALRRATILRMAIDARILDDVAATPERVRGALDAAVRAALDDGAVVTRLAGVGVLALFGMTGPSPDDPSRALAAARAARHAVRAAGALDLRAAIDAGPVLAGNAAGLDGFDVVALGPVAERTERLLALAGTGEILAGPGTAGTGGLVRVGLLRIGATELEVFRDDRP